jgi:hypothetical protein
VASAIERFGADKIVNADEIAWRFTNVLPYSYVDNANPTNSWSVGFDSKAIVTAIA